MTISSLGKSVELVNDLKLQRLVECRRLPCTVCGCIRSQNASTSFSSQAQGAKFKFGSSDDYMGVFQNCFCDVSVCRPA